MQEEREVFDSVFDIGIAAVWDMSLCDSSFGGLDGWGMVQHILYNVDVGRVRVGLGQGQDNVVQMMMLLSYVSH